MITSSGGFILGCAVVVYVINFYYTYVEIKKLYLKGYKNLFTKQAVLNIPSIVVSLARKYCWLYFLTIFLTLDNLSVAHLYNLSRFL